MQCDAMPYLFVAVAAVAVMLLLLLLLLLLLVDQELPPFFDAPLELPLPSQFWHPLPVVVKKEAKKVWVPATELPHYGGVLDGLLALLGQGLVGDLRSVALHDADHVVDRDVGYLSRGQLPEFVDLGLQAIDPCP